MHANSMASSPKARLPKASTKKRMRVALALPAEVVRDAELAVSRGESGSIDEWIERAISERDALWFSRDIMQRVVAAYEQAIMAWGQATKRGKSRTRLRKRARDVPDCGCADVDKITTSMRESSDDGPFYPPLRSCDACIQACVRHFEANLLKFQTIGSDGSIPGDSAALIFEVFAECLRLCAYNCHRGGLGTGVIL